MNTPTSEAYIIFLHQIPTCIQNDLFYFNIKYNISYCLLSDYIDSIMESIMQRRYQFPSHEVARNDILSSHKARQPKSLTASYQEFDKDALIEKRTSRFVVV